MKFRYLALFVAAALTSSAAPVQVTFSGVGSGSLGAQSFIDSQYVITINGDTSSRFTQTGAIWLPATSASYSVNGIGTGAITGTIAAWVCSAPLECGGFAAQPYLGNMIWSFRSGVGLNGYDFTTNLGPVDLASPSILTQTVPANTSAGDLTFTGASRYFIMEVTVNQVPEPGSLALLASGAIALFLVRRTCRMRI